MCVNSLHFSTKTLDYGDGNVLTSMSFRATPAGATNSLKGTATKYGSYSGDYVAKSPEFQNIGHLISVKS